MIKLIRANQKTFLAGLTIFSMLAFVANRGNGDREGGAERKYATINGKTINASELSNARAEISAMRNSLDLSEFLQMLSMERSPALSQVEFTNSLMRLFVSQPTELFMLMRHEAIDAGMHANADEVNMYMKNCKRPDADSENDDLAREGLTDLLKIAANFGRIESAVKISQPQIEKKLAEDGQALETKLIQLRADQFISKVPVPTTQQVQEQFTQFADILPRHAVPTTNPFGFGYKIPDRASYEYLRLSEDAVTTAVAASEPPDRWHVQALKYYYNHLDTYPILPGPTTNPAQSRHAPEEQFEPQILKNLRKDLVSDLRTKIETYVATTMDSDWAAYSQFVAAGSHGAEPDSSLGVPYTSFNYLLKMYDSVHTKFNVNLVADKSPGLLTQDQYKTFDSASVEKFITRHMSEYLAKSPATDPNAEAAMRKPSDPLPGVTDSTTLFVRLSAVQKAAPPTDLAAIRPTVESDWKLAQAYTMAQNQANALVIAAKGDMLDAAAKAMGQTVIPADPESLIRLSSNEVKGIVPPLGNSAPSFTKQAFKLLVNYDPALVAHPTTIIELPEDARVFVAQLVSVHADWTDKTYLHDQEIASREVKSELNLALWFNLDNAKSRLNFQVLKGN